MGLTYYVRLSAPSSVTPDRLEKFLKEVGKSALALGFVRAAVLNIVFDSDEKREFSKRLGQSFLVEDARLRDAGPSKAYGHRHNSLDGSCAVFPKRGVILVLEDELNQETCVGFFQFPEKVMAESGKILAEPPFADSWAFHDHWKSPDPRLRQILERFKTDGFVAEVRDDFKNKA